MAGSERDLCSWHYELDVSVRTQRTDGRRAGHDARTHTLPRSVG